MSGAYDGRDFTVAVYEVLVRYTSPVIAKQVEQRTKILLDHKYQAFGLRKLVKIDRLINR